MDQLSRPYSAKETWWQIKPHNWDKDDVSKLIRDPHYAGVHKRGKNFSNLMEMTDFEPMVSVQEFLTINKIDNLDSTKILTIHGPRTGGTKADLMRGAVYCGRCDKTLTSMLIDKKDKESKKYFVHGITVSAKQIVVL